MSDITLKTCPYCGGRAETHCENGAFYVACIDCFMRGPEILEVRAEAEKDAIAVWNKLPRHLQWTTELPTEPGWYWWRPEKNIVPHMVYVVWESTMRSVQKDRMFVLYPHSDVEFAVDERPGEWAGPIPEPQESK